MALRTTSYSGSSSSLNSFIKGLVNKKRAYEDSDMAYQYSRGQLTPDEYLSYIDKRISGISRNSTEAITWQKRRDSVVEDATDDRVKMQYQSDLISPQKYAEYLRDEVLPRYKEGTNEYAETAMRVDDLVAEQQRKDESAARKERSDYRMKKLFEISQLGDNSLAKVRAKMDMYQTLANEAAEDGDEAAYYRAATSYNNTLVSYQNMAESASKSALAKEKKIYQEEVSELDRTLSRIIASGSRGKDLNDVATAYLSKILQAANSGAYEWNEIDSLLTKINDMGYEGGTDENGNLILGNYLGRYATRSESPTRVLALEESRFGSPTGEEQGLYGQSYFGENAPLSGKSLVSALESLNAVASGAAKDESGNDVTVGDYLRQSIKVYNGMTGQYEIRQIKEQDFVNGNFDPKDIVIDPQTGLAFKIFGQQIDPISGLAVSYKDSYIITQNRDGKQVKVYLTPDGQVGEQDLQKIRLESDYAQDLGSVGEGLVAEKKVNDEKERQRIEEEKRRVEESKVQMQTDQSQYEAQREAAKPPMALAPAAPPPTVTKPYIETRAQAGLPSLPKVNFAPFVGSNPASNPVNMFSPDKVNITKGYYKTRKADGGYDFYKEGFGSISVNDLAKETGLSVDYIMKK